VISRAVAPHVLAAGRARVLRDSAVAGADQGLPRAVPAAPGRDAGVARRPDARRLPLDRPGRRLLRMAEAAPRGPLQGDAAPCGVVAGGVRARYRVLR